MFQLISIRQGALAYAISLIFSNPIPFEHPEKSDFLGIRFVPLPLDGGEIVISRHSLSEIPLGLTPKRWRKYNHSNLLRSYSAEEDLSTKENSKEARAWLSGENEYPGRASCLKGKTTQGS